ncbi:MAG: putative heme d1 biosynthesis radical SAM protein NirJ2 [Eubacteriales bacterium]|nr:putative heme d1 biosynthesis radical SAM protein NirJ2 [Eubacteriales bacterium]
MRPNAHSQMKIISWNTTNDCNLYCAHCYRESGEKAKGELNTEEGKKLIFEIARAGFKIMIFSGGEPLTRPDIYELISYARDCGLRPVLGSNGTMITPETAVKLKEAGLMAAGISLDSLDIAKHDHLRGKDGAWEAAVNGMKNCREAGLAFQIHTTVMDWNEPEIEKLMDFAVEIGARAHHIFFLVPTGRGEEIKDMALDRQSYEDVLTRIMNKAKKVPIEVKPTCAPQFIRVADKVGYQHRFSKGCLAGVTYCIISPKGDVQPCAYLKMEIDNVRNRAFDVIWEENEVFQRLRTMEYGGQCKGCGYSGKCGGCRARAAYYHKGDYMSADPLCILNKE